MSDATNSASDGSKLATPRLAASLARRGPLLVPDDRAPRSASGAAKRKPFSPRQAVRNRVALAVIVGTLLVAVGWSYVTLSTSRQAAAEAALDLSACRDAAGRIERLRRRPALAGVREVQATELSRRMEASARAAGMPAAALDQIEPEPSRQVGDTPYRQTPTRVRLSHVTLRQLFSFFHALASPDAGAPGLGLQALQLSAPRGEEAGDQWTADATVSYLVYDPKLANASATLNGP